MILAGDAHLLSLKIKDGLVAATMAVAQFVGPKTTGQTHQLVTQTDSHDRDTFLGRLSKGSPSCRRLARMSGISGSIATEQCIDLVGAS